jgi:hypothetical protein
LEPMCGKKNGLVLYSTGVSPRIKDFPGSLTGVKALCESL